MYKGIFISLEGPDGSGKSTQVSFLQKYFAVGNFDVVFTREPGGTAIGEKVRDIILDRENAEMFSMTEALLYAASRAQHVEEKIRPALEQGKIVICDRYIDSSIAYQGFGRHLGDKVRIINEYAVNGLFPDITFFMDLDPEVGRSRIGDHNFDRLEQEKIEFHRLVYRGYKEIEKKSPERFVSLDATLSAEEISEIIRGKTEALLASRGLICR